MMKLIVHNIKYKNFCLLVLLYVLLNVLFFFTVRELHVFKKASIGASINYEFDILKFFLISLIIFGFILSTVFIKVKDFLYSIILLILIFFVIPSAILYSNIKDLSIGIFTSHSILFISVIVVGKVKIRFNSKTVGIRLAKKVLMLTILIGLLPFLILYSPYLNFKNLILIDIYETRAIMSNAVNNIYVNYTYSWFNKILIPLLIVFGVYHRNKLTVLISVFSLIFLFLCGAHKAVFVGMIMVLVLYKHEYLKKMYYFIKFILFITISSLFFSIIFDFDYITVMTIRRTLFLPSLLDVLYFDFFKNNYIYWSETFNGLFYDYPYEYAHSYIIGDNYFNSIVWAANNGIISDGYMNWGYIGVIINCIILGFYFSFLNQLNISSKFFGIYFLFFFVLISSALPSALLTHGGLLLLFVSFYLLKNTANTMDA
ncbi:oligosaccharide repeat unit polymerase [Galbibacter sp. BG1]|uniref:O-antigen polymerase n=1 Tax=Galbibacter sp. BG1 TaxID=1170699 RepID=UPI0015C17127|nr:O-antigen polymerase [Galbibacter sp. BG1]QLE02361.1 oligosaccharide repeat unit polymerase [Galbibacter sp. BG1]